MKDFSNLSLFELAELMQALQSGQLVLNQEERERLLDEIESRVQRKKPSGSTHQNLRPTSFVCV